MSLGGLDVGTTVCRLIVFDRTGRIIASEYEGYPLVASRDRLEIDPAKLWKAVCGVCKAASGKVGHDPLEAIAVSAMGDTLIVADRNLDPVRNAILAFDTRSEPQCRRLVSRFGLEKLYDETGMPAHSMTTATKIAWVLDEAGKRRGAGSERFMCTEDFVIGRLTGRPVMSWSSAARTMLYNSESKAWWPEIIQSMDFSEKSLSDVEPSATLVEGLSRRVAEQTGLPAGLPIVTAGHDQICSAIGAGALQDGTISDNTGTFECVIGCVGEGKKRSIDKSVLSGSGLALYPHGPHQLWAVFSWFNAGSIVSWCMDNLFERESEEARRRGVDPYEAVFEKIELQPLDLHLLPHFTGSGTPWLNPGVRGVLFGIDLNTSRYDILVSALQGVGFDLAINLDAFARAGVSPGDIRATGGGSKSPAWLQLKSDMTGKQITAVEVTEASALGAAICAGTAIGAFESLEHGAGEMVALGRTYNPDPEMHGVYARKMKEYSALYDSCARYLSRMHGGDE
jgi:xylulokinase